MNQTYYTMKRRRGGEKFTRREKLCCRWYPCPGFFGHANIIGKRRAGILFEAYYRRNKKAHLLYWRTHINEWQQIQSTSRKP